SETLRAAPALGRGRLAAARLHVPVVPRLDDEALLVEAEHRAARDRLLLPVGKHERRPPLDRGPIARLDRLPEAHVLGPRLWVDPRRVVDGRLRVSERRRAEDAVVAVQ